MSISACFRAAIAVRLDASARNIKPLCHSQASSFIAFYVDSDPVVFMTNESTTFMVARTRIPVRIDAVTEVVGVTCQIRLVVRILSCPWQDLPSYDFGHRRRFTEPISARPCHFDSASSHFFRLICRQCETLTPGKDDSPFPNWEQRTCCTNDPTALQVSALQSSQFRQSADRR